MSTLDDYSNETPTEKSVIDRAPELVDEGPADSDNALYSITVEGVRYYLVERNPTTLQLKSMEQAESGEGIPSDVVAGIRYEDLPDQVRLTLKVEGYRMVGKNSLLAGVM